MSKQVYLCHKCGGNLTYGADERLYGCGCISGYVRDWQDASKDPIAEQIAVATDRVMWLRKRNANGDQEEAKQWEAKIARLQSPAVAPKPRTNAELIEECLQGLKADGYKVASVTSDNRGITVLFTK